MRARGDGSLLYIAIRVVPASKLSKRIENIVLASSSGSRQHGPLPATVGHILGHNNLRLLKTRLGKRPGRRYEGSCMRSSGYFIKVEKRGYLSHQRQNSPVVSIEREVRFYGMKGKRVT